MENHLLDGDSICKCISMWDFPQDVVHLWHLQLVVICSLSSSGLGALSRDLARSLILQVDALSSSSRQTTCCTCRVRFLNWTRDHFSFWCHQPCWKTQHLSMVLPFIIIWHPPFSSVICQLATFDYRRVSVHAVSGVSLSVGWMISPAVGPGWLWQDIVAPWHVRGRCIFDGWFGKKQTDFSSLFGSKKILFLFWYTMTWPILSRFKHMYQVAHSGSSAKFEVTRLSFFVVFLQIYGAVLSPNWLSPN